MAVGGGRSEGGLPGGGCTPKEGRIGRGTVFIHLGDQAGGDAVGTYAGEDGGLRPDRLWGGKHQHGSAGPLWDRDTRGEGGLGEGAKVSVGEMSGGGGRSLKSAWGLPVKSQE